MSIVVGLIVLAELQLLVLAWALCRIASYWSRAEEEADAPGPSAEEAAHREQVARFLYRLHAPEGKHQ